MAPNDIFLPTFGNRPYCLVGRDKCIGEFVEGLSGPVGHPYRASLYIGQRGMGKTALLLELADRAESTGFVIARVAANEQMLEEILQAIQLNGARHIAAEGRKVRSFNAGALSFSFGLTFTDEIKQNYGFRIKLALLCEELAKHKKGVLILVDEVQASSAQMRELATTYQHLVGEGKNIAIAMAGLPNAISAVLNDEILTFLNRTHKVPIGPLSLNDISLYYATVFSQLHMSIQPKVLQRAVSATFGYPYLLQLVGYFILKYAGKTRRIGAEIVALAIQSSRLEMVQNIFTPVLKGLSKKDLDFLHAMADDERVSAVSDIRRRLSTTDAIVQLYRSRLIETGVIAPVRRGELEFVLPYLREYLRHEL